MLKLRQLETQNKGAENALKFDKNIKNDQIKKEKLRELGWTVIVIWECELKKDFIMTMEWLEQEIKYHDIEGSLR